MKSEREGEPNFVNRTLFHGDNLDFLRGINSETVHLIATDPPFNKNKDFHATPDKLAAGARFKDRWKWEDDVHDEWVDQIKDDWSASWTVIQTARKTYGEDMAAFLCWLGVRVMEMHRVLREDGSFYLHIDHTAHAYVKTLLDSIFGARNFRNEIIWHYGKMSNSSRNFPRNHDTILRYTKTGDWTFNPIKGGESEYRERYKRHLSGNQVLYGKVKSSSDKLIAGRIKKVQNQLGRHLQDSDVLFDFDIEFKIQSDVIYVPIIKGNSAENAKYPTQKPMALYNKLVAASSNFDDVVLDPFCGCATTLVAAEKLGRRWLGADIWEGAHRMVLKRFEREGLALARPVSNEQRLMTFGDVHYTREPPARTDANEAAAPVLKLRTQRARKPWQKLSNKQMRGILAAAQGDHDRRVWCGGCGRSLEIEFMELDHRQPRSDTGENFITNRVLLCAPCNSRKSDQLTMKGLHRANKKADWTADADRANKALESAHRIAEEVRDDWGSISITALVTQSESKLF